MEYVFTVSEQEASLIVQGLAELPAKLSMEVITKLQRQAQEQVNKTSNQVEVGEER